MPRDTVRVKFSGKSQAKGRNNYFALDSAEIHDHSEIDEQYPILIDLWSKRTGGAPPIRLMLTEEDLATLAALINGMPAERKKAGVEDGELVCPHCGKKNTLRWAEDECTFRNIDDLEDNNLFIESHFECDGDGENGRLYCVECMKDSDLPNGVEIADWV